MFDFSIENDHTFPHQVFYAEHLFFKIKKHTETELQRQIIETSHVYWKDQWDKCIASDRDIF